MAARQIYKLERKIAIIAEVVGEREGQIFSRKSFAEWAGLNYDSLKSTWGRGSISMELEIALATAARFDRSHNSWFDPARSGTSENRGPRKKDDIDDFRRYLRESNGLMGSDKRRLADHRPDLFDAHLANFALDDGGQSSHPDEPAYLFLDLTLSPSYIADGLAYGFQEVRVSLSLGDKSLGRFEEILGKASLVQLGNGTLTGGGSPHHPKFDIRVQKTGSILEGEFVTNELPLCHVHNLFLDDVITAELLVNPYSGKILSAEGKELPSDNKQAVISLLINSRLNKPSPVSTWAVLAHQCLTVVKAEVPDE